LAGCRISDQDAEAARDFAARVAEALSPLTSILVERFGTKAFKRCRYWRLAGLTAETLEKICIDEAGSLESLWGDEAGEDLSNILLETSDSGSTLSYYRT
jgi:ATP-dependent helicase/nuclease subunit B